MTEDANKLHEEEILKKIAKIKGLKTEKKFEEVISLIEELLEMNVDGDQLMAEFEINVLIRNNKYSAAKVKIKELIKLKCLSTDRVDYWNNRASQLKTFKLYHNIELYEKEADFLFEIEKKSNKKLTVGERSTLTFKYKNKSITELKLYELNLNSLLESIGNLANLTWLNLELNQLSSLPENIGSLTNLEELSLRSNQLSSLPGSTKSKLRQLENNGCSIIL